MKKPKDMGSLHYRVAFRGYGERSRESRLQARLILSSTRMEKVSQVVNALLNVVGFLRVYAGFFPQGKLGINTITKVKITIVVKIK